MAIQFKCLCGAECSANESMVGQLHHCAACGLDIPVVAAATGEASRDQPAATAEMIAQVLSATEGGRRGDRGPGLDELRGEVAAKEVEGISEEEAARRKVDRDAFQAQLGKKTGADELIFQITGKRVAAATEAGEGAPAGEGAAAPAAPARSPAAAVEMKKALRLAAPAKPIPTGKARAATHIRIKRVVYGPSLALGVICLSLALWCIDALTLKVLPFHKQAVFPEIRTKNPEFSTDEQGKMWAMPKGMTPSPHADGKMWYLNEYGTEEPAESVEDLQKALAYDRNLKEMNLWFGASLTVTALALLFLGFWTWNDVRIVRRDMGTTELPEAEAVSEDVAQPPSAVQDSQTRASGPPASPEAAAPAPAGAPAPEGAPAQAAPGPEAASPAAATGSVSAPSAPVGEAAPPPAPEAPKQA